MTTVRSWTEHRVYLSGAHVHTVVGKKEAEAYAKERRQKDKDLVFHVLEVSVSELPKRRYAV